MGQLYKFDNWTFNSDTGEVSNGETVKRLEPTVARLLIYMIENPDRLLTRDELIENVWDNRIVSNEPVNRCISIIRHTLSHQAKNLYIETLPRKGYIAHFSNVKICHLHQEHKVSNSELEETISVNNENNPDKSAKNKSVFAAIILSTAQRGASVRPWFPVFLIFSLLLSSALLSINLFKKDGPPQASKAPSIAVMPFTYFSNEQDSASMALEMTDTVIHLLSRIQSVEVAGKTSTNAIAKKALTAKQIGDTLQVEHILEGSIQIHDNQIRVMARIIEAATEKEIWSGHFDGDANNIFPIQDELTTSVVGVLTGAFDPDALTYQPDSEVVSLIRKSLVEMQKDTLSGYNASVKILEQVLKIAPEYSTANLLLTQMRNKQLDPRFMHENVFFETISDGSPTSDKTKMKSIIKSSFRSFTSEPCSAPISAA
ncbi:winged helix-turn-helix domain-containing protein [Glaciecola sp. 1036]|uniref:winged helix-turn-helix domain-containing protein n=1 Tax=Alteromonadaceae TaxID=72275 RepID=UPI003CFF2928